MNHHKTHRHSSPSPAGFEEEHQYTEEAPQNATDIALGLQEF